MIIGKIFIKARIWKKNPPKINRIMRKTGKFFIELVTSF
jgi:hypothetical protein